MSSSDTYNEFVKYFERMNQRYNEYMKDTERINQLYTESIKNIERMNELYRELINANDRMNELYKDIQKISSNWLDIFWRPWLAKGRGEKDKANKSSKSHCGRYILSKEFECSKKTSVRVSHFQVRNIKKGTFKRINSIQSRIICSRWLFIAQSQANHRTDPRSAFLLVHQSVIAMVGLSNCLNLALTYLNLA